MSTWHLASRMFVGQCHEVEENARRESGTDRMVGYLAENADRIRKGGLRLWKTLGRASKLNRHHAITVPSVRVD